MVQSIASSLGFGSGIDTVALVADLAAASRDPKVKRLDALSASSQAKISALAKARSDLDGFATSLAEVVSSGDLRSQPSVSDANALGAVATAGVRLGKSPNSRARRPPIRGLSYRRIRSGRAI
jgi:flagellar hook-associated protein 2